MLSPNRRVLFCTATGSGIGGVEEWLDRMCRFLPSQGFDPILGLVRGMRTNRPELFNQMHPDLPFVEIDGRGLGWDGRVRAIHRCLRRVKPDIVIPCGIVDTYDACCRAKLAGQTLRLVSQIQGNLSAFYADLIRYREFIDRVVCPGRLATRFAIEGSCLPEEHIDHVPNGAAEPISPRIERRVGEPIRLAYVGRFSDGDKRVMDLVPFCEQLAARGTPFRLSIVGDGPAGTTLRSALDVPSLRPHITFHGMLSNRELYERIYPQTDALLLFSSSEAFGIVLVEAMMNGVVPVSSRYLGHASEQLVSAGVNALMFDVGDTSAAAACVELLDRDCEMRLRLAQEAQHRAQAKYTWDRCMGGWLHALSSSLECEPRLGSAAPLVGGLTHGQLERLQLPPKLIDMLRRVRRWCFGTEHFAGGEEWPMFGRDHDTTALSCIADTLCRLDVAANGSTGRSGLCQDIEPPRTCVVAQ